MTNLGKRIQRKGGGRWKQILAVGFLVGAVASQWLFGQSAPVLKISILNTNEFQVSITNGTNTVNYEIYRRHTFSPGDRFEIHQVGSMGQTNFTVTRGSDLEGYFFCGVGSDWDGDGVKNAFDAQPSNASVSNLVITIDSPVSGTVFN